MSESYPLQLPTNSGIAAVSLIARNIVGISQSPFTLTQQVFRHQGQRWEADITLPAMRREDAEEWASFLLRLRGQFGTFLLGDPANATPRGSAGVAPGTPVINGAGQTGDFLNVSGLPVSTNGYLKAGDYIQIGAGTTAKLYKVLAEVDSDESGEATLNLWPQVRTASPDETPIVVTNARGLFRLGSSETRWDISTSRFYGITFGAIEAL
jgi:hypothetical protein